MTGAVALALAGCGGGASRHAATGHASASRPLHVYRVTMSGRAESPHGAPHGVGVGVIAIHAGSVVCWRFAHLHGFSSATVAHIHTGRRGRPGPVLIPLSTAPALHHQGCTHATAPAITAIERDPGGYVNVHSARYRAGAVRGQLWSDLDPALAIDKLAGNVSKPVHLGPTWTNSYALAANKLEWYMK